MNYLKGSALTDDLMGRGDGPLTLAALLRLMRRDGLELRRDADGHLHVVRGLPVDPLQPSITRFMHVLDALQKDEGDWTEGDRTTLCASDTRWGFQGPGDATGSAGRMREMAGI